MYDIIITRKRINKRKIFLLMLTVIVVVLAGLIGGKKLSNMVASKAQYKLLNEQIAQINKKKEEQKKQEEEKIEAEYNARIEKTSKPLNEEQQYNIEHIYKSDTKRVFLTFDDGPSESVTPLILDLLKQENVKATFFVLGTRAKYYPELIQREFNEGHYVANHGYSHKYSKIYESTQATLDEFNFTEDAIKEALGNQNYRSNLFRFPGGSNGGYYNDIKQEAKAALKENGIVHLDWNCLNKDAEGAKTEESLIQNIKDTAEGKNSVVVLMHDASDKILTYNSLKNVIEYFRDNGYEFKNIYDII